MFVYQTRRATELDLWFGRACRSVAGLHPRIDDAGLSFQFGGQCRIERHFGCFAQRGERDHERRAGRNDLNPPGFQAMLLEDLLNLRHDAAQELEVLARKILVGFEDRVIRRLVLRAEFDRGTIFTRH